MEKNWGIQDWLFDVGTRLNQMQLLKLVSILYKKNMFWGKTYWLIISLICSFWCQTFDWPRFLRPNRSTGYETLAFRYYWEWKETKNPGWIQMWKEDLHPWRNFLYGKCKQNPRFLQLYMAKLPCLGVRPQWFKLMQRKLFKILILEHLSLVQVSVLFDLL